MPVRATEHLDRQRGILKGCQGTIVGWTSTPATENGNERIWNTLPALLYVRFKTSTTWRIEGLEEDNVYPVAPMRRTWYLDHQRRKPELRVTRTQYPVAPGFAITAHVAQGQTIREGVIADLCLADNGNAFTAYVAITRVQGRDTIMIFRPFAATPYQKGVALGRELLLQHWRGEVIDWKALLAKYVEERNCAGCNERKPKAGFTVGQWRRTDEERICRECSHRHAVSGTPWQCTVCRLWHPEKAFSEKQQYNPCSFYRVCRTCETKKPCHICGKKKLETEFGSAAWKARHAARRICKQCTTRTRNHWTCISCSSAKPKAEFHFFTQKNTDQNGRQMCDSCVRVAVACRAAAKANARLARTRKKWEQERKDKVLKEVQVEIARVVAARKLGAQIHGSSVPKTELGAGQVEHQAEEPAGTPADSGGPCAKHERSEAETSRYTYQCPFCEGRITSTIATGRIRHRQVCGHQFKVQNGVVVRTQTHRSSERVSHTYRCPFCDGTVESTVSTGLIDHRKVCGHQFRVANGAGSVGAQAQPPSDPVWQKYQCPFCAGTIESKVSTGRINHRKVCGHRFTVEHGAVKAVQVEKHAHQCPTCGTVVESSKETGRIQSSHKNGNGKPCAETMGGKVIGNGSPCAQVFQVTLVRSRREAETVRL